MVDAGAGWYSSRRLITVGHDVSLASGSPRLANIGLDLAAGYRAPLGHDLYVKPFAEVRGSDVHIDGFTEASQSPFALQVLAHDRFAVSGEAGAMFGGSVQIDHGPTRLEPFIEAAVEFAGDASWRTSARFVGEGGDTSPFTTPIRSPGTFGRFGVGASLVGNSRVELTVIYRAEAGGDYTTHQGVARFTCRF